MAAWRDIASIRADRCHQWFDPCLACGFQPVFKTLFCVQSADHPLSVTRNEFNLRALECRAPKECLFSRTIGSPYSVVTPKSLTAKEMRLRALFSSRDVARSGTRLRNTWAGIVFGGWHSPLDPGVETVGPRSPIIADQEGPAMWSGKLMAEIDACLKSALNPP